MVERLKLLIQALRNPRAKPPVTEHTDRRLDAVDERIRVLTADGANKAQRYVQDHR